jgi:U5 small nuclear ribonucleoprotein component
MYLEYTYKADVQVRTSYTGPLTSDLADSMIKCDPQGPTVVQVTKLFHTSDAQSFRAFGRVMSGSVRRGQAVKVLGEGYSLEDEEDMVPAMVEEVLIDESR